MLPRVNSSEEESVEHVFGSNINWLEINVAFAKVHVM